MPSAETTSIRAARGEPPVNPLGSVVGLTLGWLAASLEQSVPLTGRGRELGKRRVGERLVFYTVQNDFSAHRGAVRVARGRYWHGLGLLSEGKRRGYPSEGHRGGLLSSWDPVLKKGEVRGVVQCAVWGCSGRYLAQRSSLQESNTDEHPWESVSWLQRNLHPCGRAGPQVPNSRNNPPLETSSEPTQMHGNPESMIRSSGGCRCDTQTSPFRNRQKTSPLYPVFPQASDPLTRGRKVKEV
jgi:hypothetical protein